MALASVTSIECPTHFDSANDNYLTADVFINNSSDVVHSAQVIFRGYVRKNEVLLYEFLHEQQWVLVQPNSHESHRIVIDVWLPRFPPTIKLTDGSQIEYSVRASIDPWYTNKYIERTFEIRRTLVLKMPHVSCFSLENVVNKCCEHSSLLHKKCDPINGTIFMEKAAFCPNEEISMSWNLKTEQARVESATCKLVQLTQLRISDPSNFLATKRFMKVLKEHKSTSNSTSLLVPHDCLISIPMTLWNVLTIRHEVILEIKLEKKKEPVVFNYPIIICSEEIARRKRPKQIANVFQRIQDVDDDSDDDDDYDSEDELEQRPNRHYSVDIEKVTVKRVDEIDQKPLEHAEVVVQFVMNSNEPQPLRSLRLLLSGESRVGGHWYEFLRFKAIANLTHNTLLSPGEHTVRFQLPFSDSQYDTSILAPSLGDEIRYIVRVSNESLRRNHFPRECELLIDRFVDTWAKEAYKPAHTEEYGATKIHMTQRCFKRGKQVAVLLHGNDAREVKGTLVQKRRLRVPGYKIDDSYCSKRNVRTVHDEIKRRNHVHLMDIPFNIPPSIEICYWNVLQIMYHYDIEITLENGHTHTHSIPIWIGCTEDNLQIPVQEADIIDETDTIINEPHDELPEFEVVHPEEVREHPYWVERINTDTYHKK